MSIPTQPRTIVVRGALVHITPSLTIQGDVVATGGVLTRVGSSQPLGPEDTVVLEAAGASVVPILIDSAVRARGGSTGHELAPDNLAVFAVIRGTVQPSRIGEMLIVSPRDMLAVVLEDRLVAWDGALARPDDPGPDWVGAWTDSRRGMTQFLTADGRYSETRGGRPDAYTGCYWAHRAWIAYLDDTGFWAFGQQVDDTIHHAGFVLRRTTPRSSI